MTGRHYQEAERLLRSYGCGYRLRTLDALQLAVALDLRQRGASGPFVSADKGLNDVAATEGCTVFNPEDP